MRFKHPLTALKIRSTVPIRYTCMYACKRQSAGAEIIMKIKNKVDKGKRNWTLPSYVFRFFTCWKHQQQGRELFFVLRFFEQRWFSFVIKLKIYNSRLFCHEATFERYPGICTHWKWQRQCRRRSYDVNVFFYFVGQQHSSHAPPLASATPGSGKQRSSWEKEYTGI